MKKEKIVGGTPLTIQSVDRALHILELLAKSNRPLSVIDIGAELGIQRTTLYALINTLVENGYVLRREQDGRLMVSSKMYEMSSMYPKRLPIVRIGNRHLVELSEKYNLFVRISVCNYMGRIIPVATSSPVSTSILDASLQQSQPFHATSTGKIALAFMAEEDAYKLLQELGLARFTAHTITDIDELMKQIRLIRELGYSTDEREFLDDTMCVSFPVIGDENKLLGVLSTNSSFEHTKEIFESLVRDCLQRVKLIAMELQDWDGNGG